MITFTYHSTMFRFTKVLIFSLLERITKLLQLSSHTFSILG